LGVTLSKKAFPRGNGRMKYLRLFRPTRRRLWLLGTWVLLVVALWLLVSLILVYALTRRPHARFAEPAPVVAWGTLEEHQLRTDDGETLGAWFHRGSPGGPSVVVLHGNRGCRGDGLPVAEFFAARGCAALLVSLRAHGDSSGEVNNFGYSARHDMVAAVDFLERERPGRPVIINGTSMGAAAAIFASKELGERVVGYVLESPYRDLHQAVRNRTALHLPPGLDRLAYAGVVLVGPLVLADADRISPIDHVADIPPSVPVLFLSGTKDERALPSEAQALCDRIAGHARLVLFEGAGHGCLIRADPTRYAEAVAPLLREVEGRANGGHADAAVQGKTSDSDESMPQTGKATGTPNK
jgi:pimeloyl-ACP methyl ester carboxylesterase